MSYESTTPSADAISSTVRTSTAAPTHSFSDWQAQLQRDRFEDRHLGLNDGDTAQMLKVLGFESVEALMSAAVPEGIRLGEPLAAPTALSETDALEKIKAIASQNQVYRSYIGLGYYNCVTPAVIQRNILENPGWYTQYTPYQPEISQGRLEALLIYQTMVTDLTGLEIANASLLDEGTAAAEAMSMSFGVCKNKAAKQAKRYWVSAACHPQTIEVIKTRAQPLDIEIVVGDHRQIAFSEDAPFFGLLLQYPATEC